MTFTKKSLFRRPGVLLQCVLFLGIMKSYGQNTYTVKGKVFDQANRESLMGVSILIAGTKIGTSTNSNGNFAISGKEAITKIKVSCVGYRDTVLNIADDSDIKLSIGLHQNALMLNEVEVVSAKETPLEKVNQMQMGVDKITMLEAKMLPAIFGEVDIIKILQLKPGVKSAGEGSAGFFVRGGGSDQNLILVEHAPVYNPNHLFGFFSVFNSDAIKDVTLYKSGFPSQFGGRLSSVLDVKMNLGQADSLTLQGGIGLISSRLTLNVPFVKQKASLLLSGRRTYIDLITNTLNGLNKDTPDFSPIPAYSFYDYNAALHVDLNAKNQLSLNGYLGNDQFNFSSDNIGANLLWGNRSATLAWTHIVNERLKVSNAYFTSGYLYRINNTFAETSLSLGSKIWDQGLLSDWNYFINDAHELKFGLSGIYHRFTVGEFGVSSDFTDIKADQKLEGNELGAYVSHHWKINKRTELLSGFRHSVFVTKNKTYNGLEPRVAFKYNLSPNTSLKASYARMYQYLHLVSSSSASRPTDIWYPSEEGVKPQRSDQISLGLYQSFAQDKFFASIEGYYKWIDNAIDFRDGAQLFANPNLSKEFVFGRGWAYGLEAYVEKKKGRTTGWIGYTLAWTWRQFEGINGGVAFHPRYDRRHDFSVVVMHKLNRRFNLSGTWVYGTGNYATIAGGRFAFQDALPATISATPDYLRRNDFQMPATHRLDLSLVWNLKSGPGTKTDLTFSVYNAYSRRNPFFVFYQERTNANEEVESYRPTLVSLFPVLPSITYNFKF